MLHLTLVYIMTWYMCYFKIMRKQLGTIIHQVCGQSYHTCGGDYSPYIQSIVFPDIFHMSTLSTTTCESLWLHTSIFFYQVTCNSYMTIVVSKFIDVTPVSRVSMYCDVTSPTYLETYAYLSYI